MVRKKCQNLKTHFDFHLSFLTRYHCCISYTSSPYRVAQGDGYWVWQTANSISSVILLPSHTFLYSSMEPFLLLWHQWLQGFAICSLTTTVYWLLPFLNYASWAQPCSVVCPLELTGTSCIQFGAALLSSCSDHPCSSPTTKTLTHSINSFIKDKKKSCFS